MSKYMVPIELVTKYSAYVMVDADTQEDATNLALGRACLQHTKIAAMVEPIDSVATSSESPTFLFKDGLTFQDVLDEALPMIPPEATKYVAVLELFSE